jgi:hypothetical protein
MCSNLHSSVDEIKLVRMRRVGAPVGRLTPTDVEVAPASRGNAAGHKLPRPSRSWWRGERATHCKLVEVAAKYS